MSDTGERVDTPTEVRERTRDEVHIVLRDPREEPQVEQEIVLETQRLSVAYALLDGSASIEVRHVEAAKAVWDSCEETLVRLFGDRPVDPEHLAVAVRAASTTSRAATRCSAAP